MCFSFWIYGNAALIAVMLRTVPGGKIASLSGKGKKMLADLAQIRTERYRLCNVALGLNLLISYMSRSANKAHAGII